MDLKTKVVQLLATGSTPKLAAGAVGLTEDELDVLRDGDEQFNKACVMARSNMLASAAEKLHRAKDWRAAQKLLASAPETRDEYGGSTDGGKLEIVLNINRDGGNEPSVIEGRIARPALEHDE